MSKQTVLQDETGLLSIILEFVPPDSWPALRSTCKRFRHEARYLKFAEGLADLHAMSNFDSSPNLLSADLSDCGARISDLALERLADACPLLEQLDLSGLESITAEGIAALSKLPLRSLSLNGCKSVYDLPGDFDGLSCLRVEGLSHVPESTWERLLPRLNGLKDLQLGETTVRASTIQTMATKTMLRLDLSWCDAVEDSAIYALVPQLPVLQSCTLQCLQIEDQTIARMAKLCEHLRYLNLNRCNAISDTALLALAEHCPTIECLLMSWTVVTSPAVTELLQSCPRLERLSLQGCKSVTSDVMPALAAASRLEWLDLSWVNDLSPEMVAELAETRPSSFIALDYYGEEVRGGQ